MSEGSDHDYYVRLPIQADEELSSSSSEAFQPALRLRSRRNRLGPTQSTNNTQREYPSEPQPRRRVDIFPVEEEERNDVNAEPTVEISDAEELNGGNAPTPEQRRSLNIFPVEEELRNDVNVEDTGEISDAEELNGGNAPTPEPTTGNSDHDYAEPPPARPANQNQPDDSAATAEITLNERVEAEVPVSLMVVAPSTSSSLSTAETNEAITDLTSPSPPTKKRKRQSAADVNAKHKGTPKLSKGNNEEEDEDDGLTCPICLDTWEMSGEHRLVSLRCGHLFGDSCIRRWLDESMKQTSIRVCPQCKSRATYKDIRFLYAKRVRAIDRTEEHRLRDELDKEKRNANMLQTELATVKMSYTLVTTKVQKLEADNERLRDIVRLGGGRGAFSVPGRRNSADVNRLPSYRLYMERNFEITKETGCRVMIYSSQQSSLIASQKSAQNLFPGYGVRFIDTPSFRPLNFLHTSGKIVRDICLSADQQQLAVTSLETRCKLFDLRTRQVSAIFNCADKPIWSCSMDRNERENFIYLGDQRGGVCVYDVRYPEVAVSDFPSAEDFSPVIHITPVQASKPFPGGGFLVCKLMSLWFYEYANESAVPTRLNIDGPFLSLNYDPVQETLLVSARSNQNHPNSRFILGKLEKIDGTTIFDIKVTFFGSKPTPIMTRAGQIAVESNTLVVGYLQDCKQLVLYDALREERIQTMPVTETVYDICPIFSASNTYLAALTDNKCRVYKVNSQQKI